MTRQEIMDKLREILTMLGSCDEEKIQSCTEDTNLQTDLGLASVGMLYVVIAIEETFDIRFEDAAFGDFSTVKDVLDYIEAKLA